MSGLYLGLELVVAKYSGVFSWFRSERWLWVLDLRKQQQDFIGAGYDFPDSIVVARFGIGVVDGETVLPFLEGMKQYEVQKQTLKEELEVILPDVRSWWDCNDLFAIAFVDFDAKHLCACYGWDGIPIEKYVPAGWTSENENFLNNYSDERFPVSERFWLVRSDDLLLEVLRRDREWQAIHGGSRIRNTSESN